MIEEETTMPSKNRDTINAEWYCSCMRHHLSKAFPIWKTSRKDDSDRHSIVISFKGGNAEKESVSLLQLLQILRNEGLAEKGKEVLP